MRKKLLKISFLLSFVLTIPAFGFSQSPLDPAPPTKTDETSLSQPCASSELPAELVTEILIQLQKEWPHYSYEELADAYRKCKLIITALGGNEYRIEYSGGSTVITLMDGF